MFLLNKFYGNKLQKFNAVVDGLHEQLNGTINLVGSATLPLPEVCSAQSLPGSSCRVEGHRGNRYFPGTHPMDAAEQLAEQSISELFRLPDEYTVSVQPHSATQANHAVWNSVLQPGDTVMGLSLNDGGHISHHLGLPNKVENVAFCLSKNGIDYSATLKKILMVKPKMIICGGSSFPIQFDFNAIAKVGVKIDAHLHADLAHFGPYVAAGLHQNPFPLFDTVTLDTGKNFRGPKGGALIFRKTLEKTIRRQIFPIGQSSPNQSSLLAKACAFEYWNNSDLEYYASSLISTSRLMQKTLIENGVPVLFGITDSHLILIDVSAVNLNGRAAEQILEQNNILANRNPIPNDYNPPHLSSGLRIGTTTMTILGYSRSDVIRLGKFIADLLLDRVTDEDVVGKIVRKYHSRVGKLV